MEKGWVKLHRQLLNNHFLMYDDNAYIVFTKLLMLVNDKGEYATGRRQMAELLRKNDRTLYGVLVRLEDEGIIRLESKIKYTIIHVNNWQFYQNKFNGGQKKVATEDSEKYQKKTILATDRATLAKQGSFDDLATDLATTAQHDGNKVATTAQHSNKNKELRIKNKELSTVVDTPAVFGKPDINEMFEYWEQTIGYKLESQIKANRNACSNLIKKHNLNGVMQLIQGVFAAKQDPFAPRIADFVQLQSKYNELISWGHARKNQSGKVFKA